MVNDFIPLDTFRSELARFRREDYDGFEPYAALLDCSVVRVPYYNCERFKQYAGIFYQDAVQKGCDPSAVREKLGEYYNSNILQGDHSNKIVNLIGRVAADIQTAEKLSVLPLICGAGKSTAISYLTKQTLERKEEPGILVVTDRKVLMDEYMKPDPQRDPELAAYLEEHKKEVTALKSGEALQEAQIAKGKTPVLFMTTQRYFRLTVGEIEQYLKWGEGNKRNLILFDEAIPLREVKSLGRSEINDIASALSEAIPYGAENEEKIWCIKQWEKVRTTVHAAIDQWEGVLAEQDFHTHYSWKGKTVLEDEARFMNFVKQHEGEIRQYDRQKEKKPPTLEVLNLFLYMMRTGCIYHCCKRGNHYESQFFVLIDNRAKVMEVSAKTICMDGTAEINPDYEQDFVDMRSGRKYDRGLDNLTIRFVSGLKINKEDFCGEKGKIQSKAIARYMREQYPDTPIAAFTYKDAEKNIRSLFEETAHFGDIKGKNTFRSYTCTTQIGLNRYTESMYLTYFLYTHPQKMEEFKMLSAENTGEMIRQLKQTNDWKHMETRFLLMDLEQNLFRCAIRNPDFVDPAVYTVFCDTERNRLLIEAVRQRFETRGAYVEIVDARTDLERLMLEEIPEEKLTQEMRIRKWIEAMEPGTVFTMRGKIKQNSKIVVHQLSLETGLTSAQCKECKRQNTEFKEYLQSMAMDKTGYYMKP